MTPEAWMHLINYSIIVLLCAIAYATSLIIYRVVKLIRRWSDREFEFMNSVYFKLKEKKASADVSSDI